MNQVAGSCFWGHHWSKWQDTTAFVISKDGKEIGQGQRQERRCLQCNKLEMRAAKLSIADIWYA